MRSRGHEPTRRHRSLLSGTRRARRTWGESATHRWCEATWRRSTVWTWRTRWTTRRHAHRRRPATTTWRMRVTHWTRTHWARTHWTGAHGTRAGTHGTWRRTLLHDGCSVRALGASRRARGRSTAYTWIAQRHAALGDGRTRRGWVLLCSLDDLIAR